MLLLFNCLDTFFFDLHRERVGFLLWPNHFRVHAAACNWVSQIAGLSEFEGPNGSDFSGRTSLSHGSAPMDLPVRFTCHHMLFFTRPVQKGGPYGIPLLGTWVYFRGRGGNGKSIIDRLYSIKTSIHRGLPVIARGIQSFHSNGGETKPQSSSISNDGIFSSQSIHFGAPP